MVMNLKEDVYLREKMHLISSNCYHNRLYIKHDVLLKLRISEGTVGACVGVLTRVEITQ